MKNPVQLVAARPSRGVGDQRHAGAPGHARFQLQMRRGVLLAVLACVACARAAHAPVAELDAAALLTALANVSVVVTFYTRWRVARMLSKRNACSESTATASRLVAAA